MLFKIINDLGAAKTFVVIFESSNWLDTQNMQGFLQIQETQTCDKFHRKNLVHRYKYQEGKVIEDQKEIHQRLNENNGCRTKCRGLYRTENSESK